MNAPLGLGFGVSSVLGGADLPFTPPPGDTFFRTDQEGLTGTTVPTGQVYSAGNNQISFYRNGINSLETTTLGALVERFQELTTTSLTVSEALVATDVSAVVNEDSIASLTQLDGVVGTTLVLPTTAQILLFRNGLLMIDSVTVGSAVQQYQILNGTDIDLQTAAVASDVFRAEECQNALTFREDFDGQTGLTLSTTNNLIMGDAKLFVYRNGVLLFESTTLKNPINRYQVTGMTQITLEVAASASDTFTVLKRL